MSDLRDAPDPLALLDWYDRHARAMPWRVGPADLARGMRPDPYRVWMSEIMLQQTTVAAVKTISRRSRPAGPPSATWQARRCRCHGRMGRAWLLRPRPQPAEMRARGSHDHGGVFPDTYDGLIALPGIGPYTAAAIASIAFDLPETVLDGNVERVMARLFHDDHTPLPAAKPVLMPYAKALTPTDRPGCYAQAVMDLGATICTPRNPACGLCPLAQILRGMGRAGTARSCRRKSPKKRKPTRLGIAYLARRVDGAWLLETPRQRASGRHAGLARQRLVRRPDRRPADPRRMARPCPPRRGTPSPISTCA